MKKQILLVQLAILSLAIITLPMTVYGSGNDGAGQPIATAVVNVAADTQPEKFVPDELLIQFVAGVPHDKVDELLHVQGAEQVEEIQAIRVKRIKVPAQALEKVRNALAHNPHVKFVEPNYIVDSNAVPNDPSYISQWHLPKISAPQGWNITTGLSTVDIAIADSGVDPTHPDLAGKLLPGYNFYNNNTDTRDVYGHGTQVAGAAAAIGNNGVGVAGVAWNNAIMPLRITDTSGYGYYSTMASAITYAADHGVRIINLSFSGPTSSSTLQSAVDYAWNKGTMVFAAAGNSASTVPYYPAACTNAIAVAATDSADNRASWSNYGSWITVAAPGVGIYSTTNGGGYASVSGTSFASPITAGVAALILSVNPSLSARQVVDILKQNSDDLGTPGFDQIYGNGRVNVAKSLAAAQVAVAQSDTQAPSVSITTPTNGTTVKGSVTINAAATDNVGVAKVELYVNGALFATDTTQPATFIWDTTVVTDVSYTLQARAYDAAGNSSSWSTVTVTVQNTQDVTPPVVKIITPANNSSISSLRKVTISASATDNILVTRMELYIDGKLSSTATGGSLSWSWNILKVASGNHLITVKAFDGTGNSSSTSSIVVR